MEEEIVSGGITYPIVEHHRRQFATPTRELLLLRKFLTFQEQWEANLLESDGSWFEAMPDDLMDGLLAVQAIRNEARAARKEAVDGTA